MKVVSGAQRRRGRLRPESERRLGFAPIPAQPSTGGQDAAPRSGDAGDVVELVVPARNKFLSAARLVASSFASDLDFTIDDLDELRIAIDEAMTVLIASVPPSSVIRIRFSADATAPGEPSRLRVEGEATEQRISAARPPIDALVSHIMAAVTDRFDLEADRFEFLKSASHPAGVLH